MSKPARVLLVEWNVDGTVGGSHQLLHDLVRCLDRDRFDPVVLFYQRNRFSDLLRDQGVQVVDFDETSERERQLRNTAGRIERYLDHAAAVVRRANLVRSLNIDLVHLVNSPFGGADDWLPACRARGVACVATAGGLLPDDPGALQALLMRRFDRIFASSRAVAEQLRGLGAHTNVEVLHLGVDLDGFRSAVRRTSDEVRAELGIPPGRMLVTMVGNIRPWKGQHVALEALARLPPDVRERLFLVLVGRTPADSEVYADRLGEMIETSALYRNAKFLGARLDVPDLFSASDVALHASVAPEPFGLVLVEAMSVGTPVIAANRGGPLDIVTPETGWLFDPDDPDALPAVLEGLVHAPHVLEEMSGAARAHAARFTAASMARRVQEVYTDVLSIDGR